MNIKFIPNEPGWYAMWHPGGYFSVREVVVGENNRLTTVLSPGVDCPVEQVPAIWIAPKLEYQRT